MNSVSIFNTSLESAFSALLVLHPFECFSPSPQNLKSRCQLPNASRKCNSEEIVMVEGTRTIVSKIPLSVANQCSIYPLSHCAVMTLQARGREKLVNQSVDKKQRPKGPKAKTWLEEAEDCQHRKGGAFKRQDCVGSVFIQKEKKVLLDSLETGLSSVYIISGCLSWKKPWMGVLDKSCGLLGAGWQVRLRINYFLFDIISLATCHRVTWGLKWLSSKRSSLSWLYP